MINDRDYMRESPDLGNNKLKPLYILLGSFVVVFVFQQIFGRGFTDKIALSNLAVETGKFWAFITYSFTHGGPMHLFFNCLILFTIGRVLIQYMGMQRFFSLYGMGVLTGGITWFLVNTLQGGGYLVGASAGLTALILVFAKIQPNAKFLLFFIVPVTARQLVFGLLIFDGLGMLFTEILPYGSKSFAIAHSAHLGGFLAGWIFVKFLLNKDFTFNKPDITPPKWFRKKSPPAGNSGGYTVNVGSRSDLEKEVNRILDKINKAGFGALTQKEKDTLDQAKDKLGR